MDKVIIELTKDEMDQLTICLGFALGAAVQLGDKRMADSFIRLANIVHRDNPNWTPYQVSEAQAL